MTQYRKSSYSEKLKDPRWQKKRLEILQRDEWKCVSCGASDKTLHVHHKSYKVGRDPWEYSNSWLATLCEECHDEEPRLVEHAIGEISRILKSKWLSHELVMISDVLAVLSMRPVPWFKDRPVDEKKTARIRELSKSLTEQFNAAIGVIMAESEPPCDSPEEAVH